MRARVLFIRHVVFSGCGSVSWVYVCRSSDGLKDNLHAILKLFSVMDADGNGSVSVLRCASLCHGVLRCELHEYVLLWRCRWTRTSLLQHLPGTATRRFCNGLTLLWSN